ncbi:MAG: acylneuraminate cytidylyltransferase [Bacteroidales bacterium]|nr:acylneuraminate cytidylyltransferase [Bacteroidales bacterium]
MRKLSIGAIIQARTSSTRLPGKVLLELPYGSGITVLEQVIRRIKKSKTIEKIIIATTKEKVDNPIVTIANKTHTAYFRGSKKNVLERYYLAAKKYNLDIVVRITSDCPCIDPEILDQMVNKHLKSHADLTSNCLIKSFPHGVDAEVYSFTALEKAYKNATKDFEKDGATEYISVTNPKEFNIINLIAPASLRAPDIRITLDTPEDYALLCILNNMLPDNLNYTTKDIISLFRKNPWLSIITAKVVNKKHFDNITDEVNEAIKVLRLQELDNVANLLSKNIELLK